MEIKEGKVYEAKEDFFLLPNKIKINWENQEIYTKKEIDEDTPYGPLQYSFENLIAEKVKIKKKNFLVLLGVKTFVMSNEILNKILPKTLNTKFYLHLFLFSEVVTGQMGILTYSTTKKKDRYTIFAKYLNSI